ncbi:hypothetical protein [Roseobacter weihaiensis]|uniref:hypothetical protein n=1 Tax=Roseobacter weihaiensis TaxID=2763262 RepID=UPI001D0A806C|nr:hypothetical protein [Roseobacter sp. H9]
MLKFLGSLGNQEPQPAKLVEPARYTRGANNHKRVSSLGLETNAEPSDPQVPVGAHRPITRAAVTQKPRFDDSAHLHADTRIPVSTLRKALPKRFAQMKSRSKELAFY